MNPFPQIDWLEAAAAAEPLLSWAEDVPEDLRVESIDENLVRWRFAAADGEHPTELESVSGKTWPAIYLDLIRRFRFAAFELGPILFHSNLSDEWDDDVVYRLFIDPHLAPPLMAAGFLPFGKPWTGNYDAVCFDMRGEGDKDAPIVVLDHEQALQWGKARIVQTLAPGLGAFLDQMRERGVKPAGNA